ncbi:MAG: PilN domain-containing protein [Acidobacteriota bacterium]|nr:PilN domain-containing protein [Acidobacteriota bacterium]MDH3523653.1 PilN domain-containing protein [Acidobacteriota bacterium]
MIRINLVGEARRPVALRAGGPARGRAGGDGESRAGDIALAVVALLGVMVAGGHYLWLRHQVQEKKDQVAEAQVEVDALAPIIREVEAFKEKKARLENKVQVISDLKANQQGPVQVMDRVSAALPQLTWLTRMEVSATRLRLSGEAFNTNAIAAFLENLDRVPEFQEPYLRDTTKRDQRYTFVIECQYLSPAVLRRQGQGAAAGG